MITKGEKEMPEEKASCCDAEEQKEVLGKEQDCSCECDCDDCDCKEGCGCCR